MPYVARSVTRSVTKCVTPSWLSLPFYDYRSRLRALDFKRRRRTSLLVCQPLERQQGAVRNADSDDCVKGEKGSGTNRKMKYCRFLNCTPTSYVAKLALSLEIVASVAVDERRSVLVLRVTGATPATTPLSSQKHRHQHILADEQTPFCSLPLWMGIQGRLRLNTNASTDLTFTWLLRYVSKCHVCALLFILPSDNV